MTNDDALVASLSADFESAPIADDDKAMLRYAAKLTRAPSSISAADLDALRAAGFSDSAMLDICQVAAYYAFVNRLASGLGVELESDGQ